MPATHREDILTLLGMLQAHPEWRDALLMYVPPSTIQKLLRVAAEFATWTKLGIERDGTTVPYAPELFAAAATKVLLYPQFTPPKNESTGYLRSTLISLAETEPHYTQPPEAHTPAQKERARLFAQVIAERLERFRACKIDLSRFQIAFERALQNDAADMEDIEHAILAYCQIQEPAAWTNFVRQTETELREKHAAQVATWSAATLRETVHALAETRFKKHFQIP